MWAEQEEEKEPKKEEECVFEGTQELCLLVPSCLITCNKDTCPIWRIMKILQFIVFPSYIPRRNEPPFHRFIPR